MEERSLGCGFVEAKIKTYMITMVEKSKGKRRDI